ncbi:MAG TPA: hypothetical protein VFY18_01895 [Candidatus Limnocylindrales bacterium]|nr:hypothetical protein [Candidatus Limnocylindrales bacterium]
MSTVPRRAAALFLAAHGIAHVLGFAGLWRLGEFKDVPYTTQILNGALDVGDAGIRVVGLLWLVAAVGFLWVTVALWRGSTRPVAFVTIYSLAVCVVGLPAAIIGIGIDVAILVVIGVLPVVRPADLRPALR